MVALREFFAREKIAFFGAVPYAPDFVMRENMLARRYGGSRSTLVSFAVPYYRCDEKRNISVYAVPRDYHHYFDLLYERLRLYLDGIDGGLSFAAFADTSPFDERALAAECGIGERGDNGLIINSAYGSYIFIGSIICDFEPDFGPFAGDGGRHCSHCGMCSRACPSSERCLSAITQTKGTLDERSVMLIRESGCAWGCDICQSVCPANRDSMESPIDFFASERIPYLTREILSDMDDQEFALRAYAWKGRECISRNLEILEK